MSFGTRRVMDAGQNERFGARTSRALRLKKRRLVQKWVSITMGKRSRHLRRFTTFANKIIQLWIFWQLNPSRIMKPPCLSHSIRFNILRREATGERGKVSTGYHRETFPVECSHQKLLFFVLQESNGFYRGNVGDLSPSLHKS